MPEVLAASGPLPWREACALFFDVCSSLALLHSRRLLHRDVSPRNIRCTRDGHAKLIDFGALAPMGFRGFQRVLHTGQIAARDTKLARVALYPQGENDITGAHHGAALHPQ